MAGGGPAKDRPPPLWGSTTGLGLYCRRPHPSCGWPSHGWSDLRLPAITPAEESPSAGATPRLGPGPGTGCPKRDPFSWAAGRHGPITASSPRFRPQRGCKVAPQLTERPWMPNDLDWDQVHRREPVRVIKRTHWSWVSPPATQSCGPVALCWRPPPTLAAFPLAVLNSPPLTLAVGPAALL